MWLSLYLPFHGETTKQKQNAEHDCITICIVHLVLLQIPICSFSKQCISWIELTILHIKLFKGETGSELQPRGSFQNFMCLKTLRDNLLRFLTALELWGSISQRILQLQEKHKNSLNENRVKRTHFLLMNRQFSPTKTRWRQW